MNSEPTQESIDTVAAIVNITPEASANLLMVGLARRLREPLADCIPRRGMAMMSNELLIPTLRTPLKQLR
jgi:hypothetical protein